MQKVKIIQETLKSILLDEIKGSKKLSREDVEEIARENGYVPVKKPIKEAGEKIYWFQWDGGTRVVFNKK